MLHFAPITTDCIDQLTAFAQKGYTDSCDYTPGNLVMWARFMHYQYAIEENTLFIKCLSQTDIKSDAFLMPIGEMPIAKAIEKLQEYCNEHSQTLRFTAVPEPFVPLLSQELPTHHATLLDGWSDYIYDAQSLATLRGKALNKKRNRYNKFIAENPNYEYRRCSIADIPEVAKFLVADRDCQHNREDNMRCYEQWQCIATVKNLSKYYQPAGILRTGNEIVAFTLGEIFGSTLYIHIEKAKRETAGAAEAINNMFINDILSEYPQVEEVNREEDLGDPGLRQAKKAYNPTRMLHRYEFTNTEQPDFQ